MRQAGDLEEALRRYGGTAEDWLDLSTGLNSSPYDLPRIAPSAWTRLPDPDRERLLRATARRAFAVSTMAEVVPFPGVQAALHSVARLRPPGTVCVLSPTYGGYAAAFRVAGWDVLEAEHALPADALVMANPNNPDGRRWNPEEVTEISTHYPLMIVDESFCDPEPDLSTATASAREGLVVLRGFGSFYGLGGVRLGFAVTGPETASQLQAIAGPWPVSGPAIEIGIAALGDVEWASETRQRLADDCERLDTRALESGWSVAGGTRLFRLYEIPDAMAAQHQLAERQIWTRRFPYSATWLRVGLPGDEFGWLRITAALAEISE
ncbi:MAG: threonine-phosphate decarboxylase [Pseudomonadota bacterium]